MNTTVTITLHEQYVQIIVRFYKKTGRSYIEYSLCGANVAALLKEPMNVENFEDNVLWFVEDDRDVTALYLDGFIGHFMLKYKIIDKENILSFDVEDSRFINPSRGGRSVSGAFQNKTLGAKIFMNLLNAIIDKDVNKLNGIMQNLYSIGG